MHNAEEPALAQVLSRGEKVWFKFLCNTHTQGASNMSSFNSDEEKHWALESVPPIPPTCDKNTGKKIMK